jgi:hypothetical protein
MIVISTHWILIIWRVDYKHKIVYKFDLLIFVSKKEISFWWQIQGHWVNDKFIIFSNYLSSTNSVLYIF